MIDVIGQGASPDVLSPGEVGSRGDHRGVPQLPAQRAWSGGVHGGAYIVRVGRFLEGRPDDGGIAGLRAADVTRTVQAEAARVSVGSTQFFVAGLRAFLRFCFLALLLNVWACFGRADRVDDRRGPVGRGR